MVKEQEVYKMLFHGQRKQLDRYKGFSTQKKIKEIQKELESGCTLEKRITRGRELFFYIGEKTVFAVANLPPSCRTDKGGRKNGWTIMDTNIYDKCFADGKGSLSFVRRNHGSYKAIAHLKGNGQMPLHRLVMREEYGDEMLKDADVVDHKFMSALINTAEALRFATYSQNRQNSRRSHNRKGEFAYNPRVDFMDTWYVYVLHKMLGIGTWEDIQEYNIS